MLHDISGLPLEKKIKIRDALYNRREYIDEFINNQSTQEFNSDELAILKSWKHFEKGKFFIYKHLKMHSIFLDDSGKGRAFAVSGILILLKRSSLILLFSSKRF